MTKLCHANWMQGKNHALFRFSQHQTIFSRCDFFSSSNKMKNVYFEERERERGKNKREKKENIIILYSVSARRAKNSWRMDSHPFSAASRETCVWSHELAVHMSDIVGCSGSSFTIERRMVGGAECESHTMTHWNACYYIHKYTYAPHITTRDVTGSGDNW